MNKTLVIGASTKSWRYSFQAILRLKAAGEEVWALGKQEGEVDDVKIYGHPDDLPSIQPDTITLYIHASHQPPMYDWLISLAPKRIIFNKSFKDGILNTSSHLLFNLALFC